MGQIKFRRPLTHYTQVPNHQGLLRQSRSFVWKARLCSFPEFNSGKFAMDVLNLKAYAAGPTTMAGNGDSPTVSPVEEPDRDRMLGRGVRAG